MKSFRRQLLAIKPRELTELEHRRARARLIAAATERAEPKTRPLVVLVAAAAVASVVFFVHSRHEPAKLVAVVETLPAPKHEAPAAAPAPSPARPLPQTADGPPRPPVSHAAKPKTVAPGASFAKAFSEFEKGSYGAADVDLESFAREFPTDPRAEDAAYLRAVARRRLGDSDGAGALARAYLEKYPTGLRRPEAQRIAQGD